MYSIGISRGKAQLMSKLRNTLQAVRLAFSGICRKSIFYQEVWL